jgi:hypothetical protein
MLDTRPYFGVCGIIISPCIIYVFVLTDICNQIRLLEESGCLRLRDRR